MENLTYINNIVNTITVLDRETKIAIANRLLMRLEQSKDITRWQFWDRYAVSEQAEAIMEHEISEDGLDIIMQKLSDNWNQVSASTPETDALTYEIGKINDSKSNS
jgi:hypothetical protein